jgi:hypothetical protein
MIKAFPLDYMHLVSLGVVKKLLKLWIKGSKGDLAHKLDQIDIENINKRAEKAVTSMTSIIGKP